MKRENMEIKTKYDNITNLLIMERDDNKNLKNKLQEYKQRFELFKELSIQKVKNLDNELNLAKEKERILTIKQNGEKSKEKYNDYMKDIVYQDMQRKINEYQNNIKKNDDIIKKYKTNNFEKKEENKKLLSDKNSLIYENEILKKENEEMKKEIINYKKTIRNCEKDNKELKQEIEKLKKVKIKFVVYLEEMVMKWNILEYILKMVNIFMQKEVNMEL